jgi:hypothetical protein
VPGFAAPKNGSQQRHAVERLRQAAAIKRSITAQARAYLCLSGCHHFVTGVKPE